jgi:hypothetical protein
MNSAYFIFPFILNTVFLGLSIIIIVLLIYTLLLAIKALRIYIGKNS